MPELVPMEHDTDSGGEPEPDLNEVQQRDTYRTAVLVEQNGPVGTQRLPSRLISCRSVNVIAGQDPQLLLGADPRRSRLYLKVAAGSVYVGSRADCSAASAYVLETTFPLELWHTGPVYVAQAFGSPVLSYLAEAWAD